MNWRKIAVLFYGSLGCILAIVAMNTKNTILLILACLCIMIQFWIAGIGRKEH